jgi:hypothetical protein
VQLLDLTFGGNRAVTATISQSPDQAVMDESKSRVQIAGLILGPSTGEAFLEGRHRGRARYHRRPRSSIEGIAIMTKYQEWKLYGQYLLRRIGKRTRSLLSRVIPGIEPARKKPRSNRVA